MSEKIERGGMERDGTEREPKGAADTAGIAAGLVHVDLGVHRGRQDHGHDHHVPAEEHWTHYRKYSLNHRQNRWIDHAGSDPNSPAPPDHLPEALQERPVREVGLKRVWPPEREAGLTPLVEARPQA